MNPLYQAFDFNLYEVDVLPNESLEIKVTFKPTIPNHKYVDNFQIINCRNYLYKVCLKGESQGKTVVC